jgi:hypothetical protein
MSYLRGLSVSLPQGHRSCLKQVVGLLHRFSFTTEQTKLDSASLAAASDTTG